jgi:DNA modification methylase
MQRLIRVSSRPGELILDPFAGSGAAALAALKEGRNFIAFEKDKRYFEKAETEINSAKALFLRAKTLKGEMRNETFTDF